MRSISVMALVMLCGFAATHEALGNASVYALQGTPVNPPTVAGTGITPPDPFLYVSLNPQTLPPTPDPHAALNLTDSLNPSFLYPSFEVEDYSFDIEQTLSIGSQSSGSGNGSHISFNPFVFHQSIGNSVTGFFDAIGDRNHVLYRYTVTITGLDPASLLTSSAPPTVPCLPADCAALELSFLSSGVDPTVSFSLASDTTAYSFQSVPEPETLSLLAVGLVGAGLFRRRRTR